VSKVKVGRRTFLGIVAAALAGGTGLILLSSGKFGQPKTSRVTTSQSVLSGLPPRTSGRVSVEEALARRRSVREYADRPLTIEQIMQLLWASQGITLPQYGFRTAPSAGGTYPLEVYVVAKPFGVETLEAGIYHYEARGHRLVKVMVGDFSEQLKVAALNQEWVGSAPVNFVITSVPDRTTGKYGERGVRYVWQETGHAAQNIYLQAVALGLGNVVIGGFHDSEVQRILQLSDYEKPAYVIAIGIPRTP